MGFREINATIQEAIRLLEQEDAAMQHYETLMEDNAKIINSELAESPRGHDKNMLASLTKASDKVASARQHIASAINYLQSTSFFVR